MIKNFGKCSCGFSTVLNSRGECPNCVFKKNHDGKTKFQVYWEKEGEKKRLGKQIKRTPIKKKFRKPTGERELFIEIWNERPHYCSNPKCRKWLGEEPLVNFFSHRKAKSTHPELRLEKTNIDLLCRECHHQEDFGTKIIWGDDN